MNRFDKALVQQDTAKLLPLPVLELMLLSQPLLLAQLERRNTLSQIQLSLDDLNSMSLADNANYKNLIMSGINPILQQIEQDPDFIKEGLGFNRLIAKFQRTIPTEQLQNMRLTKEQLLQQQQYINMMVQQGKYDPRIHLSPQDYLTHDTNLSGIFQLTPLVEYNNAAKILDVAYLKVRPITKWSSKGGHISERSVIDDKMLAGLWDPQSLSLSDYRNQAILLGVGNKYMKPEQIDNLLKDPNNRLKVDAYTLKEALPESYKYKTDVNNYKGVDQWLLWNLKLLLEKLTAEKAQPLNYLERIETYGKMSQLHVTTNTREKLAAITQLLGKNVTEEGIQHLLNQNSNVYGDATRTAGQAKMLKAIYDGVKAGTIDMNSDQFDNQVLDQISKLKLAERKLLADNPGLMTPVLDSYKIPVDPILKQEMFTTKDGKPNDLFRSMIANGRLSTLSGGAELEVSNFDLTNTSSDKLNEFDKLNAAVKEVLSRIINRPEIETQYGEITVADDGQPTMQVKITAPKNVWVESADKLLNRAGVNNEWYNWNNYLLPWVDKAGEDMMEHLERKTGLVQWNGGAALGNDGTWTMSVNVPIQFGLLGATAMKIGKQTEYGLTMGTRSDSVGGF